MKKLFLVSGCSLLLVLLFSQRGPIALKVMEFVLNRQMSESVMENYPDGMTAVLCGAGSPMPSDKRSGPCIAIIAGDNLFVIDAGTNGVRNLNTLGLSAGRIMTVFLTHFHSDHIDGLGELAMTRWVTGNHSAPLPVVGPPGTSQVVNGFNKAYELDSSYRNAHHGDSVAVLSGSGMEANEFEVPEDNSGIIVYKKDDLVVTAFGVDHFPVSPAVGYKFSYKDRVIVVSGDTKKTSSVAHFSKNADLLIHEALNSVLVEIIERVAKKNNRMTLAKIASDIPDYHTSPLEAAEIARNAGVKHLLFYHVVPPTPLSGLEAAWLNGVDDVFENFTLGYDGTTISLPANSDEVIVK